MIRQIQKKILEVFIIIVILSYLQIFIEESRILIVFFIRDIKYLAGNIFIMNKITGE